MPTSSVDETSRTNGEIASPSSCSTGIESSKGTGTQVGAAIRLQKSSRPDQTGERVDDVLETLHRSLKDQETVQRLLAHVKKQTSQPRPLANVMLSGATAKTRPPRRAIQVQPRKLKRQRPLKEPRAIHSARSLTAAGESLGLDMSTAKRFIASSDANLKKRRQKAAASEARKALAYARNAASEQLQPMITDINAKIGELIANGGRSVPAEKAIAAAKSAIKKRNYRTAIATVSTAKKMLSDAEVAFIRRILLESRQKFVAAKRAGANIDTSVRALVKAKDSLRQGDLAAAVRMARRAETAVDVTMSAHREASRSIGALARAIAAAEQVSVQTEEQRRLFAKSKALFEDGSYFKSTELSMSTLASVDACLQEKVIESVQRAEGALALAKDAGAHVAPAEKKLKEAKASLAAKEYAKALTLANTVLVATISDAMTNLRERLGGIGQFAKSVAGEIESLSQVQDAIIHSRERSLEMARKYSSMSEDIVSQAYDNASAYMRVSQDIVKQAYDCSVGVEPGSQAPDNEQRQLAPRSPAAQILGIASTDRKLRIIDLYLSGRIDDKQLDKLLALVDSSSPGIEISDEVPEAQFGKR